MYSALPSNLTTSKYWLVFNLLFTSGSYSDRGLVLSTLTHKTLTKMINFQVSMNMCKTLSLIAYMKEAF